MECHCPERAPWRSPVAEQALFKLGPYALMNHILRFLIRASNMKVPFLLSTTMTPSFD